MTCPDEVLRGDGGVARPQPHSGGGGQVGAAALRCSPCRVGRRIGAPLPVRNQFGVPDMPAQPVPAGGALIDEQAAVLDTGERPPRPPEQLPASPVALQALLGSSGRTGTVTTEKTDRVRGWRAATPVRCRRGVPASSRAASGSGCRSPRGALPASAGVRRISQGGVRMPARRGRQTDGLDEIPPRAPQPKTRRLQPRVQGFTVHRVQVDGQGAHGKRHRATGRLAGTSCRSPLAGRAASSARGRWLLQQCRHRHVQRLSEIEESFVEQSPPPVLHVDEHVAGDPRAQCQRLLGESALCA